MWDFQCEILDAQNFTLTDFEVSCLFVMVISILPENTSMNQFINVKALDKVALHIRARG